MQVYVNFFRHEQKNLHLCSADFCNLSFGELVLAYSAERTNPIFGKGFKRSAGSDAVIRIANCGIVLVPAYITSVFFHKMLILVS